MTVETPPKLMTADELLAMPDDGMRHELVRGELVTMSPAGFDHSEVTLTIGASLRDFVRRHRLGKVVGADCGFVIRHNPDTVFAPDAAFVAVERPQKSPKFYLGAPDLAVEVISPSDTYTEVAAKVEEYLAVGTRIVIVVDPQKQTARIETLEGARRLTIDDSLDGGDVVPGWKLPLKELFE
jgi:Uma2 family endonuclease